jgi:dynein heavy chain
LPLNPSNLLFPRRDGYHPVAAHSAILFFCISELVHIDPMYQFSLPWFIGLYHKSIQRSVKRDDIEERIQDLKRNFTSVIYQVGSQKTDRQ